MNIKKLFALKKRLHFLKLLKFSKVIIEMCTRIYFKGVSKIYFIIYLEL